METIVKKRGRFEKEPKQCLETKGKKGFMLWMAFDGDLGGLAREASPASGALQHHTHEGRQPESSRTRERRGPALAVFLVCSQLFYCYVFTDVICSMRQKKKSVC